MYQSHRDRIHLKAPGSWINDPNGFIYYRGQYHLFYQYFPYAPVWGTMHWGHAVSDDLVNWEHKGVALFPTKYGDQNGCFSGSAIENEGRMHLFYTGIHYRQPNPDNIHNCLENDFDACQMRLISEDGIHFDNFNEKCVVIPCLTNPRLGDRADTRDPKVWRGKKGWYMVLGSRTAEERGKLLLYRSDNLEDWTFAGSVTKENEFGSVWECPDYFETGGRGVLIFSPMRFLEIGKEMTSQTVCMTAAFDEDSGSMTLSDTYQYLDYGLDLYAAQSTEDAQGRRVVVAWLRMPEAVDGKWSGMFCLPRVVEVKNGHIYFRVHPNVEMQYTRSVSSVEEADPVGYRVSLELEAGKEINIGGYRIYRENRRICTDRTAVFGTYENYRTKVSTPEIKEGNRLDIYVDENLIEVYVNQGEYVISNTVYGLSRDVTAPPGVAVKIETLDREEK